MNQIVRVSGNDKLPPTSIILLNAGSEEDSNVDDAEMSEDVVCASENAVSVSRINDLTARDHCISYEDDPCSFEDCEEPSFCDTGLTVMHVT